MELEFCLYQLHWNSVFNRSMEWLLVLQGLCNQIGSPMFTRPTIQSQPNMKISRISRNQHWHALIPPSHRSRIQPPDTNSSYTRTSESWYWFLRRSCVWVSEQCVHAVKGLSIVEACAAPGCLIHCFILNQISAEGALLPSAPPLMCSTVLMDLLLCQA